MQKHGILVIDKPAGISSHDCVRHVRRTFKTKKVGHAGTLDVEATGVLVLGLNKGTKLLGYMAEDSKTYLFKVRFGVQTTTHDHVGDVVVEEPVSTLDGLDEAMRGFIGEYMQTPPAYSAVKHEGKKLYEYARCGIEIPEKSPRKRQVYAFERLSEPEPEETGFTVEFRVESSTGLYVRQLAFDLARKIGTFAHTTRIRRVKSGPFAIDVAFRLADLSASTALIPLADALPAIPAFVADEAMRRLIKDGRRLHLASEAPRVKLIDATGGLLAVYDRKGDVYQAKHVMM